MKKFLKFIFYVVGILAFMCLALLSYCEYEVGYKPYRGVKFDRELWLGSKELNIDFSGKKSSSKSFPSVYGTDVRCKMYDDIVKNHLKKGMSLTEVEDLLGKPISYTYCLNKKIKCANYVLGTCYASSLTLDHGDLYIWIDENQVVTDFGRENLSKKLCDDRSVECFTRKGECERWVQDPNYKSAWSPEEVDFEKW